MRDSSSPKVSTHGVLVVASGPEPRPAVAGLDPLLRHCLALQSAGVDRVYFVGLDGPLPSDERVKIDLHTCALEALPSDARCLIIRSDWTVHRSLPARLASLSVGDDEVVGVSGEGIAGSAIFVAGAEVAAAVVGECLTGGEPEFRAEPVAPGEFALPASTSAEVAAALPLHLRSLIKASGGAIDRKVMRPLSLQITRVLLPTSVTPNFVTWVSLALALLAAVFVGFDDPRLYVTGAVLHFGVRIIDCVDGELARMRYQGSEFGQFLDTIADGIGVAALMAAVTYRVRELEPHWLYLGIAGVLVYLLVQVLQLWLARASTGGGSLQAVEWAFLDESASGVDRLVGIIHGFVRIDFISTAYAVLIALDQLQILLVAHALASLGGVLYLAAQLPRTLRQARS